MLKAVIIVRKDLGMSVVAQGAQRHRVPSYTVMDRQLGVQTVCVIGPANSDKIDKFTYALKLL